jgi:hypothetical protein
MRTLLPLLLIASLASAALAQSESSESAPTATPRSVIGYSTVAEALSALKAKQGVQVEVTKPDSWVIVNEPGNIQWSFTPDTHRAHPAVVRRAIKVNGEGGLYIEMSALCQAEKTDCDKLLEDFKELNERIRQSVRARLQQGGQHK